jgi:Raf kinase inhibitor-like YbhB/YbcL family protein
MIASGSAQIQKSSFSTIELFWIGNRNKQVFFSSHKPSLALQAIVVILKQLKRCQMNVSLKSLLPLISIIFLISCGGGGGSATPKYPDPDTDPDPDPDPDTDTDNEVADPPVNDDDTPAFALSSENFNEGNAIPLRHACTALGGTDASPQFSWTNAPAGTASYALIMDDETPPCGTGSLACVHWALFNIPASTNSLDADVDIATNEGSVEGYSYIPTNDYEGPCPPSEHTYNTTIYALDASFEALPQDSTFTRSTFESTYSGNILDQAELTGTFDPDPVPAQETISVTVAANDNGSGNVYVIDGEQKAPITLNAGTTYTFTHPSGHPIKFSTTADGTHGGGSEYTSGVDTSASGSTVIEVTSNTPVTLYYYCSIHNGMGGTATIVGG